jgi:uncharacterized membrane protein YedE/YeeE
MRSLVAFVSGLVFGLGLLLAGMFDPAKIVSFLDVAGHWDPSLALVLFAAVATAFPAFRIAARRSRALSGARMALPATTRIDARLVVGSGLFGLGWGLSGFCPGPAVVAMVIEPFSVAPFLLGMVAGMVTFEWREKRLATHLAAAGASTPSPEPVKE